MKNLVLFGFMGSGKSTIGRLASAELHMPFVDTDVEIERRQKASISEIFEKQGEAAFRDMESELIEELSQKEGLVIATGGGAILRKQNVDVLKRNGMVVFLHVDEATVLKRTSSNQNRPLLKGNAKDNVHAIMVARTPLYTALPYHVETTGRTAHQVLNEILRIYKMP